MKFAVATTLLIVAALCGCTAGAMGEWNVPVELKPKVGALKET